MFAYISSRLLSALLVILGVLLIVFFMIHMVPGDPVEVMLGDSATLADRVALRQQLGLEKSILHQLTDYFTRLLTLDLGQSIHSGRAISELLQPRLLPTLILTLASMSIAVIIAFPLGIIAAVYKGRGFDHLAMFFSLIGIAIPNFLMGPLLILLFSIGLSWLPVGGYGDIQHLWLPALTLGTALAAILARMIRASLLEVLNANFITTARAKGLSPYQVIAKHALRNALLPVITVLGMQIGVLLGGAVITEMIFSWPGIGQLTIESIQKRDYPVVQACILLIAGSYVLVNTVTEIIYAWVDPRIRLSAKS